MKFQCLSSTSGLEMREVGRWVCLPETSIADVYFWGYPRWVNDFSWFAEEVCFKRAKAPSTRSEDIGSQPMPYTGNNKGNNGHGLGTITNSHILKVALTICSLQMPISILASNRNSYTLHRWTPSTSQPHNFSPLARLQIPTFHQTTVFLHLVWAISV